MRLSGLAAALLLAGRLGALGSSVTWLGGALPYDTVPHLEADPKLLWEAGSGHPALGAALDAGLTDWWMLQGDWIKTVDESRSDGRALSRLRLLRDDIRGFGLAAYAGADLPEGGAAVPFAGLIASYEGGDISLVLNAARLWPEAWRASVGFWGPYVAYFVRPGFEAGREDRGGGAAQWLLPQLAVNFGGDLSLDLGCRFELDGDRGWRVLSRLSYQLFPNP